MLKSETTIGFVGDVEVEVRPSPSRVALWVRQLRSGEDHEVQQDLTPDEAERLAALLIEAAHYAR